jgi:hypothetical protein
VGVEKQRQPVGKDQVVEIEQLNLLTGEGLRGVRLSEVQRVHFAKAALEQEFRKALEVLATGHDKQKKTVSLHFAGQGKRPVRVAYIAESPMWKTSYRLDVQKDKVFLQGWAIVENTSEEDWNNVRMGLISGRPISFRMDLYEPLFVPRPVVEPELFASLRPPTYGGSLDREDARRAMLAAPRLEMERMPTAAPASPAASGVRGGRGFGPGYAKTADGMAPGAGDDSANVLARGAATASATELGEYFQYALKEPVSLARQKSALLPIVNQDVGGTKVSIFNENVHAKYPLLGLRFHNNTPMHLSQGPITVFENGVYAGDARIGDLQPNEKRLISYAIDLGTEVEAQRAVRDDMTAIKILKGILHLSYRLRETKTYTVKNRSDHARTVLIEHPFRVGYNLVKPAKPAERSRDFYRFEVAAEPNTPVKEEVIEELPRVEQIVLTNLNDDAVRFYIRSNAASDAVKKALEQALALKGKVDVTMRQIAREEQALKSIEEDQSRMRANMARVPQTAEAYKRYLKKFDEQETEIENRHTRITKLQETAEQERKAYEDYVAALNVE